MFTNDKEAPEQCQRCVTAKAVMRKRVKIKGSWKSQNLCLICFKMYKAEGKTEDK